MSKQPEYGPWIAVNAIGCPVPVNTKVQMQFDGESRTDVLRRNEMWVMAGSIYWHGISAYRVLREPVRETRDYANVWGCYFGPEVAPMFAEHQVSETFVKGSTTTTVVDGKPVRSLWVADTESDT